MSQDSYVLSSVPMEDERLTDGPISFQIKIETLLGQPKWRYESLITTFRTIPRNNRYLCGVRNHPSIERLQYTSLALLARTEVEVYN